MASSIGKFDMLNLSGMPPRYLRQLELEARAGVDGFAVWDTGERGEPFNLLSLKNTTSFSLAQQLYEQYTTIVGRDPVPIVYANRLLPRVLFQVLSVQPMEIAPVLFARRGQESASYAICRCEWMLLPINPALIIPPAPAPVL